MNNLAGKVKSKREKFICPFHEEKTPSLFLENGKFHCFGCGKEGTEAELREKINENRK